MFAPTRTGLTLAALLGMCSSIAMAQPSKMIREAARLLEGTTFVIPMNQYSEGNLEACGFEFKALTFDTAYKKGEPIVINGSFALRKIGPKQVFITYKLGTFNFVDADLQPEAPNFAWIKLGAVMVKPEKSSVAETDGYRLYISSLKPDTANGLESIMRQRQVTVGFNRKEGGLDVVVPLDLSVRDTSLESEKALRRRDDELGKGFATCIRELLADLK